MKRFRLLIHCILIGAFTLSGCKSDHVHIQIENKTGEKIAKATVSFGPHTSGGGGLADGMKSTELLYPYPITPEAVVVWEVRGAEHRQQVNLKPLYRGLTAGTLIFSIAKTGVEAKFVVDKE